MIIKLTLPLPNMKLSSNQKKPYFLVGINKPNHKQLNIKNADKDTGKYLTLEYLRKNKIIIKQYNKKELELLNLYEVLIFYRIKNNSDIDNTITSFKNMRDGIFLGLGINDKKVKIMHSVLDKDKDNPRLEYLLTDDIYLFRSIINGD